MVRVDTRTAVQDFTHPATDHLHAMADPDGEHQKRHQDAHGIEPESHGCQQPELPDHGDDGAHQWQDGQLDGSGVQVQQYGGDHEGDAEKQHHAGRAFGDVHDGLRKPDDVHTELIAVMPRSDFFELLCNLVVVESLSGFRVNVEEFCGHECSGEIGCNQPTELTGVDDVLANVFQALFTV